MSKEIKFNIVSDIHIDFWVKIDTNMKKTELKIDKFVEDILPIKKEDILVIAGDLGNNNFQNMMLLRSLKRFYMHIIIVFGNHDYYMESKKAKYKYRNKSINRINEMKLWIKELENIHILDGDIVTINGINFGGCTMWYDLSYGVKIQKRNIDELYKFWKLEYNDGKLINHADINRITDMYEAEKIKLENIIDNSDVIVTHVSPDYESLPSKYHDDIYSSFYLFDGSEFFNRLKGKVWCFGHIHSQMYYCHHQCHFINAPIGYPPDKGKKIVENKIQTIHL